jgi:hypothetical protein
MEIFLAAATSSCAIASVSKNAMKGNSHGHLATTEEGMLLAEHLNPLLSLRAVFCSASSQSNSPPLAPWLSGPHG